MGASNYDPLPPDQIQAFMGSNHSHDDRVLAWVRCHTVCYPFRSPFCVDEAGRVLRRVDCARDLNLDESIVSRAVKRWAERGYIRVDYAGRIWLCGAVARSSACGPRPRASIPESLPPTLHRVLATLDDSQARQLASELRDWYTQRRLRIAAAVRAARNESDSALETIMRSKGFQKQSRGWRRGPQANTQPPSQVSSGGNAETSVVSGSRVAVQATEPELSYTATASGRTSNSVLIDRNIEKQLQPDLGILDNSSTANNGGTGASLSANLRRILNRLGFQGVRDSYATRILRELGPTPLDFFESVLQRRLRKGDLGSGALPLVAADAHEAWLEQWRVENEATAVSKPSACPRCGGRGYIGPTLECDTLDNINAAVALGSISLCSCEMARSLKAFIQGT